MTLEIISPEKSFYKGDAELVIVPGAAGAFMVLPKHAAIISSLVKGDIIYMVGDKEHKLGIQSGFIETHNDKITICVEQVLEEPKNDEKNKQ